MQHLKVKIKWNTWSLYSSECGSDFARGNWSSDKDISVFLSFSKQVLGQLTRTPHRSCTQCPRAQIPPPLKIVPLTQKVKQCNCKGHDPMGCEGGYSDTSSPVFRRKVLLPSSRCKSRRNMQWMYVYYNGRVLPHKKQITCPLQSPTG
jgi:hypothetical protein